MGGFLKEMADFRSDFREQIDAKVDHMLEMLASIQQHLEMQEMTTAEEIGKDFSFAKPQLHNLPYLKIEVESEILPPNQHLSPMSNGSSDAQLESEGFVEVLNHAPITTVAKSRFEELKSDVLVDLQLEESNSEFEVLPKPPLVVSLRSAAIKLIKNNNARKVFDEFIRRDVNPLKEVSVFVDLGKEIYIYVEENIVKNEPTDATLINCFEMNDIESIMSFDPGGDSKVFDSYKKLFYIEELVLLQDCSNSPRSVSLSFCLNFGKLMHTHMEISRRFVIVFVNSDWVESYATLLNINSVAMVFNDNSLISKGRHYEIYTPRVCEIGFFLKFGGVMLEVSCGYGVTSTGITHEGGDIFNRDVFDVFHTKDDGGNFRLQSDISNMEEEYPLGNCCIKYAGVGVAESITDLEYVSSERLQTSVTDSQVLTCAGIDSLWKANLFRIMDVLECKNDVVCLKNSEFCEIASPHYEPVKLVGKKHLKTYGNFGNVHDILSRSFDEIPSNDMDLFLKVLYVFKTSRTALVDNFHNVVIKSLPSVGKMNHLPSVRRKNQTLVLSFMEPNAISGAIVVHSFEKKNNRIIMFFNSEECTLFLAIFAKGLAYGLPKFVVGQFPKLIGIDVRNQVDVSVAILDIDENSQTYNSDIVGMVDVIFFNATQSDLARIFVLNASYFLKAEGHFVISIKANYIDSIVLAESVFVAEVKKLQVEHFKLIEMVTLEPFEQYHVCDWIKMFDWLLSKLPSQFRYMSREDTTHSRGKNCCGNGRVRVWRFGRGRVIGGAEFRSRKASQLGHFNILFQNLTMEISSLANICKLLHSSPRGNPIAENLGIKLWECLRDFIIPTTLKDDISNLVLFGLRGIIGAMLKPLFHEFCVGAIWSLFMTYKLDDVEKVGEPPVSHVTDELDSHLLHSAASNFRFPHSLCLSANLSPSAGQSLLLPTKNVQRAGAWMKVSMLVRLLPKHPFHFRHLSRGDTTLSRGEYCCGNGARLEGRSAVMVVAKANCGVEVE